MSHLFETIIFASLFGAALRVVSGPSWPQPVIAFSSAFVIVLAVEPLWSGEAYLSTYLVVISVATFLGGTALVHAALVYLRPK